MKEYGGYIELEKCKGEEYHPDAVALNCGRGAVEYLIWSKHIQKLYLPYYLCDSVVNVCRKNNIVTEFYNITKDFKVDFKKKLKCNEYIYIVNYYTQLEQEYLFPV